MHVYACFCVAVYSKEGQSRGGEEVGKEGGSTGGIPARARNPHTPPAQLLLMHPYRQPMRHQQR